MYFENTLLVKKVALAPRAVAQSFAPVRKRQWPWVVCAAVVLVTALANPMVPIERQLRAQELRASIDSARPAGVLRAPAEPGLAITGP